MRRSTVLFLVLFFILVLLLQPAQTSNLSGLNPALPPPSEISKDSVYHIATLDKVTDAPVQWVAAGGGLISYGSGQQVYFAREEDPGEIISSLSFDQGVSQALILGRYACLGQEGLGIRLLDLEDPARPVDVAFYPLPVSVFRLASWGNLLFVGGDGPEVRLIEIYPSGQPIFPGASQTVFVDRGSIPTGTPVAAIAVSADGKAYVAVGNEVKVFDVSDPSNATEVGSFPLPVPVRSLAVNGDHLFVAAGAGGLYVIDLSSPEKTETLATYAALSESLYAAGRRIYLASGANGLLSLETGPASTATFDVQVADFGFVPHMVYIHPGDTVRWTGVVQRDFTPSETPHILAVDRDSVTQIEGLPSIRIFDNPGTFQFNFIPSLSSGRAGVVAVVTPLAVGDVVITPPSVDFGNVTVGTPSDQTITITNQSVASALHGTVGSLSDPFSVVSGGGAFNNVLPGQSVSVTVRFLPVAAGLSSATLTINYTLGLQGGSASVPLIGTGVSEINISVTPSAVNFGNVAIGSSSDQTVTITNLSNSTKTLSGAVGGLSNPFSVVSGGGIYSLAPGRSKSVVVRFSPTAAGAVTQNLLITHNAGNQSSPTIIPLSGTGTAPIINIAISPASVSFGEVTVGQTLDQTLAITNQTSSTGTLSGNVGSLSAPFSLVSGGGAFSLAPGQSKPIVVRFSPTAAGTVSQDLSITHNAGNQVSPATVPLHGTGTILNPSIDISISPASIDFGNGGVGQMYSQTLTVTNQSSSTGTLTGNVGTPTLPFSVVSGGGAFSLTPGQSKSVVLRFAPTALGPFSGTLPITHNAGNQTSPINIPLSGTGVTPPPETVDISISPQSLDFGSVSTGQAFAQSFTIINQSTSTGTLTGSVGIPSAPFSVFSGGGTFSLPPGQSKSVVVRFSPTAAGTVSQDLLITHNAGNQSSPASVLLSGTGITPIPVAITVTPASINFGSVPIGQVSDQTVTITNQASSTGTLTGNVQPLSAPFSVVSGGGSFSLSPGQSRAVTVRFLPTVTGPVSEILSITHNAANQSSPVSVLVSGTAIAAAINISISPASIDFGDVTLGQFLDRMLTLTNQSTSTGSLTGYVGTSSPPFSVVSGGGKYSLTPGQSVTVTIRFSPTAQGQVSGDLPIIHNATNRDNPAAIPLSATGVAPDKPNVVISLLSGPSTGTPGARISILNMVTNQGTLPANNVTVDFYLSTDTQIDAGDRLIGKRSIRILAPGTSSGPVSTQVTLPRDVVPGPYFIGARVTSNASFDFKGITLCLPLSKVVLLSPGNRSRDNSLTPTLDWSEVNGASVYEVQVAADSKFNDVTVSMTGLTDTQWTVAPALSGGTTYYWHVRAVSACGPGPWSSAWSFKTM